MFSCLWCSKIKQWGFDGPGLVVDYSFSRCVMSLTLELCSLPNPARRKRTPMFCAHNVSAQHLKHAHTHTRLELSYVTLLRMDKGSAGDIVCRPLLFLSHPSALLKWVVLKARPVTLVSEAQYHKSNTPFHCCQVLMQKEFCFMDTWKKMLQCYLMILIYTLVWNLMISVLVLEGTVKNAVVQKTCCSSFSGTWR